jgi:hypothetical protein
MSMKRFLCFMLFSLGIAATRAASAGGEPVLVVAEDLGAPVVVKLRSELTNAGYRVDLVSAVAGIDFGAEAALRHARALLRVAPLGDSIDLWTVDGRGGSVRFRERIAAAADDDDARVLAIRAQEAVHGKLLPEPEETRRDERPVDRPAPSAPRPTGAAPLPRFAASLGPSLVLNPGGLGAAGDAALGFSWMPGERLALDAVLRVPVIAGKVEAAEGTARVSFAALGAGASYAFAPWGAPVRPLVGAGVAVGWSHVDGVASPSFLGHSDDLFAAMPYLRAALAVRLSSRLNLRADVLGAVSAPAQEIRFAGRPVATLGAPMLDASLALETVW